MLSSLLRWHWVQNIEQKKTTKNQRNKKHEKAKHRKTKSFTKRIARKCRLT